jgi:hypothetical protein
VRGRIEETATAALRYVTGDASYAVRFDLTTKGGRPHAVALAERFGVSSSIRDGHGGGISDVVGVAMRAAALRSRGDLSQVLVLDEPFKHVQGEHMIGRAKDLLAELARRGLQLVVVSSREDMAGVEGSRTFRFSVDESGATLVEQMP